MNKTIGFLLVLSISAMLLIPAGASAPKLQLPNYTTWDIDMTNSDETGFTGNGVYIAVLDTGLAPNWKDYFPKDQIAAELGKGFKEVCVWDKTIEDFVPTGRIVETTFIGDIGTTHGTHVVSTIIGYNYYAPADALGGWPLPPIHVQGIAPDAIIIPIKVLADYQAPGVPGKVVFGTSDAVAAGIDYATDLYLAGYAPMVISMSLGGPELSQVEKDAIDRAISAGVIVVVAAGNEGTDGMSYPGAYDPVISVGSCGWTKEWLNTDLVPQVYISDFSSRELPGQYLDVVAPGSWVRGPYPGVPGYSHLPWWSNGWGWYMGRNPGNFYYVGGTSMATPHVSGIAAQMLEKNPALEQADIESYLKGTALAIPADSVSVYDISPAPDWYTVTWGDDATGAGLVQADLAVDAVPAPPP